LIVLVCYPFKARKEKKKKKERKRKRYKKRKNVAIAQRVVATTGRQQFRKRNDKSKNDRILFEYLVTTSFTVYIGVIPCAVC
jgi:hypothetical protein